MRWYTADFDQLSWRDVRVHGFRLIENGDGSAELQLDVDFILERPAAEGGPYRLAQAMLQFHEASALRISLDYVACSAGMSAFAIEGVSRAPLRDPAADDAPADAASAEADTGPWRWRVDVHWPDGFLEFESSGFSQWLVGEVVEQDAPSLAPAERL